MLYKTLYKFLKSEREQFKLERSFLPHPKSGPLKSKEPQIHYQNQAHYHGFYKGFSARIISPDY